MEYNFKTIFKSLIIISTSVMLFTCASQNNSSPQSQSTTLTDFKFPFTSKVDNFYLGDLIHNGKINKTNYYIYSQRRLFDTFYKEAKDLSLEQQKNLWIQTSYEKVGKSFFTELANIEFSKDAFDKEYDAMVTRSLEFINTDDNYTKLTEYIKEVEKNIEQEVKKTIKYFGNVGKELHVVIYYIGSNVANGRLLQNNNQKPMFIIIAENFYYSNNLLQTRNASNTTATQDIKIKTRQDLKNIIPHELAHNYQMTIQDNDGKTIQERLVDFKNYVMLFIEGSAVYVETQINKVDDNDFSALTHFDYSSVNKSDIAILAKEFLTFYNKKAIDNNFEHWEEWLSTPQKPIQGKIYPQAIGYFLGYWVTKDIVERKNIKLDDYLKLSETDPKVKDYVYDSLVYLSKL